MTPNRKNLPLFASRTGRTTPLPRVQRGTSSTAAPKFSRSRVKATAEISEGQCFRKLLQACRADDAVLAFDAHTAWLASLEYDLQNPHPAWTAALSPFPEWIDMQLAMVTPGMAWRGIDLARAVTRQRQALVR